MSKQIDFSKPLSEEDAQYVADRPWLRKDAELSGFNVRDEADFVVDDEDDEDSGQTPDGFESEDGDESATGDDAEAEDDESDEEDEGEEGDEDEVAPYAEWEYPALKEEAGNRGLPKTGSKEQLIERLEQDDASAQE